MEEKLHFKITKYCPEEIIFDGEMTFREAHQFMDEHASFERRVGFEVFNEIVNRWEDFGDSYHGGRKVYDKKGVLYILDPDYRGMYCPTGQQWQLWCIAPDGQKSFCQSFKTKEQADRRRNFLQTGRNEYKYAVVPSDIELRSDFLFDQ